MAARTESDATTILAAPQPDRVIRLISRIAGSAIREIESTMPNALAGRRQDVRVYVQAYRELTDQVLKTVSAGRPDVLGVDDAHHIVIFEAKTSREGSEHPAGSWLRAALEQEAMAAPFSHWVGTFGVGPGTAIALIAVLRALVRDAKPLAHPRRRRPPTWALDDRGVIRFYRAVLDELEREETPVRRILRVMGLNRTELAALFGVRRQALDRWELSGVPPERQEKWATLNAITDLLLAKLKPDRVPGVVRRPGAAYDGKSILDAIGEGEEERVLSELRHAFDWSVAA